MFVIKEWYLITPNTRPNVTSGFGNDAFVDYKDDAFAEVLDTVGYEKAKELVQAWKQSNEIKSNIKTENLINSEEPSYYNFADFII